MAIDKTASDSKGKHVEPLSSTLHITTMDVDCSGLTLAPLDGEFLIVQGRGEAVGQSSGASSPSSAAGTPLAKADAGACNLRMVWSNSSRSDLQALGRKRVPVVWMGGMHLRLGLYNYDKDNLPQAGDQVYVAKNKAAAASASGTDRLVAEIASGDNAGVLSGWCVGVVISPPAAAGDPVEIMLHDQPRLTVA